MELVEDSSSASAKFYLTLMDAPKTLVFGVIFVMGESAMFMIREIKRSMNGVYEITPDSGTAFFLRGTYLENVKEDSLVAVKTGLAQNDTLFVSPGDLDVSMDGVFSDDEATDILHAALVYSIEKAAMNYLSRAEHCRAGLLSKLVKKGMEKKDVDTALDYLEDVGYLDDERFAGAWIRTRYISHAEGRTKLASELAARGVDSGCAKSALDQFFKDHDQGALCERAVKKYLRVHPNPDEEKMFASLQRAGFTYQQIKKAWNLVCSDE